MSDIQIVSLITLGVILVLLLPRALQRSRGNLIVYVAAWLAVLTLLVFIYDRFGPF